MWKITTVIAVCMLVAGVLFLPGLLGGETQRAQPSGATRAPRVPTGTGAPSGPEERPRESLALPASAQLVLSFDGLGKLGEDFAGTPIGKLFATPELRRPLYELDALLRGLLSGELEGGEFAYDDFKRALFGHRGRVTLALGFDTAALESFLATRRGAEPPGPWLMLVAGADGGKTDLMDLLVPLRDLCQSNTVPDTSFVTVGAKTFRLFGVEANSVRGTVPTLVGDQLVWFYGDGIEKAMHAAFASDARDLPAGESLSFELDPKIIGKVFEVGSRFDTSGKAAQLGDFLRAIGFAAIETLRMGVSERDGHLVADVEIGLGDAERGVFDLYPTGGLPTLLGDLPSELEGFSAGRLDMVKLWRLITDMCEFSGRIAGARAVPDLAAIERQFEQRTGVRLREDLLAGLGAEIVNVPASNLPAGPGAAMSPLITQLGGGCLVVSLRDPKRFATMLDAVVRSYGLHVGRRSHDHAGYRVHSLRALGVSYGIADDRLLVSFGEAGLASQERLLAARRAHEETGVPGKLPADIARRIAVAGDEGWQGITVSKPGAGIAPMRAKLALQVQNLEATCERFGVEPPPGPRIFLDLLAALEERLEAKALGRAVLLLGSREDRFRARFVW